MSRRLTLTLAPHHESILIGDILRRELQFSAAIIRRIKWLDDGILLDGEKVPTRHYGKAGQVLSALIGEENRRSDILPVYGNLNIVYEDEDFLVLNKDSGVVVHPTHCHKTDTLGNFLLYYYDSKGFGGEFHPVHRLDRGTSGLLLIAKHPYAQERFTQQLHSPELKREYLALCWGKVYPEEGQISAPIRSTGEMKRLVHPKGLPALTHYKTLKQGKLGERDFSLVTLALETGRTHQIRVHLSHLGHPLLGDELYGQGDILSHCALHAYRLSLLHPITKKPMVFTCPPPEDMMALLP